ncbi:conserved hypothetical protein [Sulfuricella denitrificans skB26]|uniref:Uncharacterized protein n=1 Tax=Sulfuricella denitrificans (strain DSM 22764 / NBRC 105220 / skB26) TaxID=1163617 RepID=S6AAV4_SULDS|nr:hypothetical protein [Sulfuricella denitrificans]BAN34093.1 conserved hypothetical protein [Sulfuricella denitrificans skB26]
MKLYENIVIGNFLYGLGFAVRARTTTGLVPSVINLLQQTPADKELADVLLEFPGVIRLIEFKQLNNKSNKEKTRHEQLTAAIGGGTRMAEVSRAIHWFVETHPENKTFISRIVPYLDAYPQDKQQHSLAQFISSIAEDVVNGQNTFSPKELRGYLSLVARCQGSGSVSTGGLLLAINAKGDINFVELTDMMQLRLQHKNFVAEIKANMEKALEQDRQRELSLDRKDRGYEHERS